MSLLKRLLGLSPEADRKSGPESASLAQIEEQLAHLDPEAAHYVAAFACVLARVAQADLEIDDQEVQEIRIRAGALAELDDVRAALVADIARTHADKLGGTQHYTVTREFRRISTREQRLQLLESLYAVAAADGSISTTESKEVAAIGVELGFTRAEVNAVRAGWRDHLAELQGLARR